MATALAAQLAKIRSNTVNPLDLKAQRKAHSQSLLFDPLHASNQDFETIYQICLEGFEELCQLDARFGTFARSIFSESSKVQDRAQMTKVDNEHLDVEIDHFLYIIGSKLSLKPAHKAVEWLVRRFRIHESNTTSFVFTFLPYHTSSIFKTVISLIPSELSKNLKFLHPYITNFANPPRHALVQAVSNSPALLRALSNFVIRACQRGYEYQVLVSFWASLTTEAVVSIAERPRSSKIEAKQQHDQDTLRLILPILSDSFSVKGSPNLRIGSYMILAAVSSKFDLENGVLHALMRTVSTGWQENPQAGLVCLSILAEHSSDCQLPSSTVKELLAIPKLSDVLCTLHKDYEITQLVLGIVVSQLTTFERKHDLRDLVLLRSLLTAGLLRGHALQVAIQRVITSVQGEDQEPNDTVRRASIEMIQGFAESQAIGNDVQKCLQDIAHLEKKPLPPQILGLTQGESMDVDEKDDSLELIEAPEEPAVDFDALINRIDSKLAYDFSFLGHSGSFVYGSLAQTFCEIQSSRSNIEKFISLPVLRKPLAMTEPFFLTFFTRLWCSTASASARASAIRVVRGYLKNTPLKCDVQILIPYIVQALSDRNRNVRQAAADLVRVLSKAYSEALGRSDATPLPILGKDQIYGQNDKSTDLVWLTTTLSSQSIDGILLPGFEECLLDADRISSLLIGLLQGSHHVEATSSRKEMKKSSRTAIFAFLCSHTVNSPLYGFKLCLLRVLNKVDRRSSSPRTRLLLPILTDLARLDQAAFTSLCGGEGIEARELATQSLNIVHPHDRDGCRQVQDLMLSTSKGGPKELQEAAFRWTKTQWHRIDTALQCSLAAGLLQNAVTEHDASEKDQSEQSLEILRTVHLPTSVLLSFINDIPALIPSERDSPPKRKRMNNGETKMMMASTSIDQGIRKASVVLEIVEQSTIESRPELVPALFTALVAFSSLANQSHQAIGYLQSLTLDCLQSILGKAKKVDGKMDASGIRAEVLIDCIQATTQPQVRNKTLLLVATLADVVPTMVLHSVMPIFTYMGTSILAQEDEFSAYVVRQTMESVVSRLVATLKKDEINTFSGTCELLHNFAAAFEHVPTQRRVELFASLMSQVGPSEYLFALIAILSEKFPHNEKVSDFVSELCSRYDALTQLKTIDGLCRVILDAWQPEHPSVVNVLLATPTIDGSEFTHKLLPLTQNVARSNGLHTKLAAALGGSSTKVDLVKDICSQVFEKVFNLVLTLESNNDLIDPIQSFLDAFFTLVPTSQFVQTMTTVFGRSSERLGAQILKHFESRLSQTRTGQADTLKVACLDFLPQLLETARDSDDVGLQIAAVRAIDRVTAKFGKTDHTSIINGAQAVCEFMAIDEAKQKLQTVSLLCLTTMIKVTGEAITPTIPNIFNETMRCLDLSIYEGVENKDLNSAGFSLLQSMLLYVPTMITGSSLEKVLRISYESANAEMGAKCEQVRQGMLLSIPGEVDFIECLTALNSTWSEALVQGAQAVKEFFALLRLFIEKQTKKRVASQSEQLGTLLLKAYNLRHSQLSPRTEDSYYDSEIDEVEQAVNSTAIAIIYKLNDASFRPMLTRFMDWSTANREGGDRHLYRLTTIYSFLFTFFSTLKSIVTNYAGLVIESATDILNNVDLKDPVWSNLWLQVLHVLQVTFENDQDDFFQSPAHFTPLSTALLSQFPHAASTSLHAAPLITTITALASATDSSTPHHRTLNTGILAYFRDDSPSVRLMAVQCQRSLTQKLGEEWLAQLPEMLPFVNEALEDDDEQVEQEVREWMQEIEELSGESVEDMLQ